MTHDELLAKLWILPPEVTESQHHAKAVNALRTIVELHKPIEPDWLNFCEVCLYNGREVIGGPAMVKYPCPTIQAIEKELK